MKSTILSTFCLFMFINLSAQDHGLYNNSGGDKYDSYQVVLFSIKCIQENDAGKEEEIYGTISARTRSGNRSSYEMRLMNVPRNAAMAIKEGSQKTLSKVQTFVFSKAAVDRSNSFFIINGHLKENDGRRGDDDLGKRTMKIPMKDITTRTGDWKQLKFQDGGTRVEAWFYVHKLR